MFLFVFSLINNLNSISDKHPLHFDAFTTVLQYALDTKKPNRILKYVQDVDALLVEWKFDSKSEQARKVYKLMADICKINPQDGKRCQVFFFLSIHHLNLTLVFFFNPAKLLSKCT